MLVGMATGAMAQGVTLVEEGRSAYVIYREAGAAPSVLLAAQEVQRIVREATGVELPIVDEPPAAGETPAPRGGVRMISIGNNTQSRACGIETESLPHDAFRMRTRSGNVYLLGKDFPGDNYVERGWTSRGTLHAAYDFLERFVGVRWLMPGEAGEEIPKLARLALPALDETQNPRFPIRYIDDIQDRRPPGDKGPNTAKEWLIRQKMPSTSDGRRMDHSHFWIIMVPQEVWTAHPEWLAKEPGGKPRDYGKHPAGVKFCTTNPELVQTFADGVIEFIETRPNWRYIPISPSDGGDFCECPECLKLVRQDPYGRTSYSLVMLTFYNAVAKIVGQKYPEKGLAGYVYYNYMYPPDGQTGVSAPPMEPQVWLVQAPLNYYGYGLLKAVYREEFAKVVGGWLKITPNFVYHNYSNWMRAFNGQPLPAAREILKLEIPTAAKLGAKGVEMLGLGAWGYGGPTNYLYAKQMWNPTIDVDKTYEEWLRLAYGPAYEPMRKMLDLIERRFVAYKANEDPVYRGHMYEMNYEKVELIYLPIFPEMERLYLEAAGKALTAKQRRRLEMFGDNLMQLHWGMTRAGMTWDGADKSTFARTDEQYQEFLKQTEFAWWIYRDHGKRYTGPIWKGDWRG
jgi:hypothetical protein